MSKNRKEIPEELLQRLIAHSNVDKLSYSEIVDDFRSLTTENSFRPTGICRVDPRNGDRVIFSPRRSQRPTEFRTKRNATAVMHGVNCPVCEGNTTGIIDIAPLSEGYTFLNKNMFPIVSFDFPGSQQPETHEPEIDKNRQIGTYSQGGHWLQWISSVHDADFHNMPVKDIAVVLSRIAKFEGLLLGSSESNMPAWTGPLGSKFYGFVGIIRNFGQLGGASLAHGHLQIAHTNVIPRAILDDRNFFGKYKRSFGDYMYMENPEYLNVRDFGDNFRLCVPYFLKRPYSCLIVSADPRKSCLHQFGDGELLSLADSLSKTTQCIKYILEERLERSFSYNLIFHTGPVGTFYIEVIPHSQELGGFEQMGWYICQSTPVDSVDGYREALQVLAI